MEIKKFLDDYWNWVAVLSVTATLALIAFIVWLTIPSFRYIGSPPIDQVENTIDYISTKNALDFQWLYKENIIAHLLLIVLSLFAAIFAGITTKDNVKKMKVWSIIATSLTAAIGTGLSTFHVHDNLDKLAAIEKKINIISANYAIDRGGLGMDAATIEAKLKYLHPHSQCTSPISFMSRPLSAKCISEGEKKPIFPLVAGHLSLRRKEYIYCKYENILTDLDERRLLIYAGFGWKSSLDIAKEKRPMATATDDDVTVSCKRPRKSGKIADISSHR